MFVHVHPDIEEAGETLSTFKFVERFSTVEGGAGKSSDVRELKEQICYLKAALAKKEAGDPHWQDVSNIQFFSLIICGKRDRLVNGSKWV